MKMLLLKHKRTKFLAVFSILLLSFVQISESLVVPQELVTILSLIYSNIPPIKKGTDSRVGFGFRLGEHADFQVMVELGPQKATQPIGSKVESDSSFNKRQVSKAQQYAVLRKQQLQLLQQQQKLQQLQELTSTERTASNWLENWSEDMNVNNKKNVKSKQQHVATKTQNEKVQFVSNQQQVPKMPVVAEQSLQQLQLLYQMATTTGATSTSSSTSTTTAAPLEIIKILSTTPPPFQGGSLNLGGPAGFTRPDDSLLQSIVEPRSPKKSKSEITKELMNVSLEADE